METKCRTSFLFKDTSEIKAVVQRGLSPVTMAILVIVLAMLYAFAALMMIRINKLHSTYLEQMPASSERLTQGGLLQQVNANLEMITKVPCSMGFLFFLSTQLN